MACELDMTDIGRVVLRVDIVVLQETLGAKIVDEPLVFVMFVNSAVFILIDLVRDER
jgi:hypothetical protein